MTNSGPGIFAFMRVVRDARGITGVTRAVLSALVLYVDGTTGMARPSMATLAKSAGFSRRATQKAIGRLIDMGVILTPEGRGGRGADLSARATRYVLVLERLQAMGAPRAPGERTRSARGAHVTTVGGAPRAPEVSREETREGGEGPRPLSRALGWDISAALDAAELPEAG